MRILILLCCVWLASAGTVPDKCDRVTFDGKYYDRELLTAVIGADSFSFAKSTNTLYFSYDNPNNQTEGLYSVGYYNIDTNEFKNIPEVNGFTTAINTETGEVYLGGDDGIQKFNPQTKNAEPYAAEGITILYMYFDKILFYIPYHERKIYSYDGEEDKKLSNLNAYYMIGDIEEYYFVNKRGLFRVFDNKTEKFANAQSYVATPLARDNNKKIFVGREDGVYTPNTQEKKLDKVADIERIQGFAFDKDNNIIYSDYYNIYKLTLSQVKCPPA